MSEYLQSWNCKGCTNICYRQVDGEVHKYCRQVVENGDYRTKWVTENYVACLDYTTDPNATDPQVRMHDCELEEKKDE